MRHPLRWLEGRYGDTATLMLSLGVFASMLVYSKGNLALAAGILLATLGVMTAGEGDDRRSEVETAQRAYVEGDIDLAEYEARLELILDDEAERIRAVVEDVRGIGPETSADLALEFDTVQSLKTADRDDLKSVHNVGPKTAEKIAAEVGRSR